MKRSSYFISARSGSADLLASELILAMHDQYQRLDCYGILGEWTGRTRANKLGELSLCISAGLHDRDVLGADGEALYQQLLATIEATPINLAILVGYSFLHHKLAASFKKQQIPVILYEITPSAALAGISIDEARTRIDVALGITPSASEFVRKTAIPYFYIGSPHKDRVDRVVIEASSLGLQPQLPLVSLFPGGRAEGLRDNFAVFEKLAASLSQDPNIQVVLSLAEGALQSPDGQIESQALAPFASNPQSKVKILVGMHLELLSLSSLAVCGSGAITVECGLFEVPAVSLYALKGEKASSSQGLKSLLNQTMGRAIITEAAVDTAAQELLDSVTELLGPSPRRDTMLRELAELKVKLQGFAAENAAAYIGREVAQWQQSRKSKDTKTA